VSRNNCKEDTTTEGITPEVRAFQIIHAVKPNICWVILSLKQWRHRQKHKLWNPLSSLNITLLVLLICEGSYTDEDVLKNSHQNNKILHIWFNACLGCCEKAEVSAL